jgi:raffinose/stachyose/melibiose transport system substrate-binding protein
MKRPISLLLVLLLAVTLLAGCAGTGTTTTSGPAVKEITLSHNKVEIDTPLKAYAAEYEKTSGVKVNIQTIGGGADYGGSLKAALQSGNFPDIFVIEGPSGYDLWKDKMADLTDQVWVKDTDVEYVVDGKVYGFPVAIEGYGLAYNKALLDKAKIDPKTLVNFGAVKAAFEKLDSMKAELGIDAVISMAAGPEMTWVTGLHNFNIYLTNGLAYGDTSIIDKVMQGEVDTARLTQYAEYVNLLFKYSNKQVLLTGNYDAQANAFASQKTVFIHQGNWLDPTLVTLGATFDMAYAPHACFTTDTNGIFVAAPSWYVVNKDSKGAEEAKKFLTSIATTDAGHKYMVEGAGMVPAFKSVKLTPKNPLSKSVMEWSAAGKTYSWQQYKLPDGFGMKTLGPIYEQLASGKIDVPKFVELITTEIKAIKK